MDIVQEIVREKVEPGAPVARLVQRSPVFVPSELTIRQVAEVLESETIGVVLVRSHGRLAGIVSERDVVRALAEGADPDLERADGIMVDDLLTAAPEMSVADVGRRMLADEIRHVPVLDGDTAIGVVSLRDVAGVLAAD